MIILSSLKHEEINAKPDNASQQDQQQKKGNGAFGLEGFVEISLGHYRPGICLYQFGCFHKKIYGGKTICAGRPGR
jgi:hypothetical protein